MLPTGVEQALLDSAAYFVHLAIVLVPLFLAGSFLVGLAQEYLPPEKVEQKLRGHDEGTGNVLAAAFGAVTPFCSCSTVPALAAFLQAGAPLGLAFSFLLASPLVNEIAIILLLGLFGLKVTVLYVLTTFTAAVVGGIVIGRLGLGEHVRDVQLLDTEHAVATDGGTCGDCSEPVSKTHREHVGAAGRGAWSFVVDMTPYLLLGMTVGALIHGAVPIGLIERVLGPENPIAVVLAALAGAPVYISMSGMLPIGVSLMEQGIPVGTVLAFVIGGAGVSIPNLILLHKLFERRLLLVYAGTVVTIGTVTGALFNAVLV